MNGRGIGALVVGCAVLAPIELAAADEMDFFGDFDAGYLQYRSDDEAVRLRGSLGVIGLEAREHVFAMAGAPENLSLLIWQSAAPMVSGDIEVRLPDEWTVAAELRAAISGDSYMEDYDWFGPDFVSYGFNDWTHRSQHPNTGLDWYLDGGIKLGRNVLVEDGVRVNVNGGLKYTDVQWAAVGGSYTYSDSDTDNPGNNFRAYTGTFPETPAITYRQQLPTLFAGLDIEAEEGDWVWAASARGGMTLFARATDYHWMRTPPLQFSETLHPAPLLAAAASAEYRLSDGVTLSLEAGIEKVFLARGDTEIRNNDTGALIGRSTDTIGAELGSVRLSAGLTGRF